MSPNARTLRPAPRNLPRARASCLLAASLFAACGGGGAGAGAAGRGNVAGVPTYTVRAEASPWSPPASVARHYEAARAGASRASSNVTADPALNAAAQAMAERVASDPQHRSPAASVVQGLSWAAGVIDPVPGVLVMTSSAGVPADQLAAGIAEAAQGQGYNRVGVGSARGADGGESVVVALSQRRLTLAIPVPRQLAPGGRLRVNGTLAEGLSNPELAVTHPDGRVEHIPLGDGPQFVGQLPVAAPGTYQVEVLGEGPGGATVIANFPVYVGVEPPATSDAVAGARTESAAQAEAAMLQLLNESRRAGGRAPLQLMPSLSGVARAHSEDMASHHFVAHNSPTTGTPAQRLQRASLSSGLILENLGRGSTAREIHEGLMASPGHRANILNPDVTHVGIGVALEASSGGGLFVTQNFIQVAPPINVATAPAQLLEIVNAARARRGADPVTATPDLSNEADAAARAYFGPERPSQQAAVDRANRGASRMALRYRRVSVLAAQVTALRDAGGLEPLFDPAVRFIGIGVAQGSRPDTPPSAVFVVYVLGYPR